MWAGIRGQRLQWDDENRDASVAARATQATVARLLLGWTWTSFLDWHGVAWRAKLEADERNREVNNGEIDESL
jgi:hypothetical protein